MDKNQQSRNHYRKQRNFCVTPIRKARQQYFSRLGIKHVKTLKSETIPFREYFSIISLAEDGKTITEDLQIAEIFNNYLSTVIQ